MFPSHVLTSARRHSHALSFSSSCRFSTTLFEATIFLLDPKALKKTLALITIPNRSMFSSEEQSHSEVRLRIRRLTNGFRPTYKDWYERLSPHPNKESCSRIGKDSVIEAPQSSLAHRDWAAAGPRL